MNNFTNTYSNYKNNKVVIITILLMTILILLSITNTYSTYNTIGEVTYNHISKINIIIPYDKIDILKNSYLKIDKSKYRIKNIKIEDTIQNENIIYYNVSFEVDIFIDKEIINIKILYDKQRIYNKLFNIVGS